MTITSHNYGSLQYKFETAIFYINVLEVLVSTVQYTLCKVLV